VARLETGYSTATRLLGIPRYLWRRAVSDAASFLGALFTGDRRSRFAAAGRLFWFAGYLRECWSREPGRQRAAVRPVAG
jgi:hypothetical protein